MSKKFENLITLTQIQNGAPGATGAPGVSTSTKFIYCVSESEDITTLPPLPEKGGTNASWTSTPHGVNQTQRYEFISSASSYSVGGKIEWYEYSTPALWSKWAQDGTGVEIKGLAYVKIEEPIPGEKYVLYIDQGFTQPITEASNGDSYLANGYLFVYNEEDGDKFSCVGKIQGPNGKDGQDGAPGKDGQDGKDGKDGKDGIDGKDANTILIVTNTDKINRFYVGKDKFALSHKTIRFTLYNNPYIEGSEPIEFESNYQLGYFDFNDNFQSFDVSIKKYITFGITQKIVDDEGNVIEQTSEEKTLFLNLQEYIDEQNPEIFTVDDIHLLLAFRYVKENQVLASKILPVENGVTPEMAKFDVTAASINASVGSSKMVFTEDGLEINNGDFTITQGKDQVFGFETEQIGGQDFSKLTMRGTVYADNGSFTGEVHATHATFKGGKIGGFDIKDGKLTSTATTSENNEEVSAIELDGNSGNIIAHNIELGNNAKIKNQIQLGTTGFAYLRNPDMYNGVFIKSGRDDDILIKNDGTAKFGEIAIDGANSQIYGNTWNIGRDYANFSNVNVSGSIETAVFKTNSVQAAGGAMIFRPSYKGSLKNENGTFVVYLESTYEGAIGNQVQIVFDGSGQGYFGEIEAIEQNRASINWVIPPTLEKESIVLIDYGCDTYVKVAYNYPIENEKYYVSNGEEYSEINIKDNYSTFSKDADSDYLSSTDLFVENNEMLKSKNELIIEDELLINSIRNLYTLQDDILIGINSGRSGVGMNGKILPRGLTLTSPKETMPKLYLGDLSQVGSNYSGYGLYADNVFLNGSLTTKVGENSYAGVNTLNGVSATAFSEGFEKKEAPTGADTSKIVFWAGADSVVSEDIEKAYFQVTEAGSLYAQRAKLEDTLLVGGTIEAAEIHTAALHGKDGALLIYDGTKGIQFKKGGEENPEQVVFSINTNGLAVGDKNFINIDGENINIIGTTFQTEHKTNYLSLETIQGEGGYLAPALRHTDGENNCGFYFEKTQTVFKMNQSPIQTWTTDGVKTQGTFELDQGKYKMQYKNGTNGCDLYVVMS